MAEDPAPQEAAPKKKSKKPLLIGLVLAFLLGGGGFYATWSGLILGSGDAHASAEPVAEMPAIAFVPLEPLMISLGSGRDNRHLRFTSQLEVAQDQVDEVTKLQPRIVDVLNGYLRAIDVREFDDPSALVRMRAQLLRRIQIVTGNGRVRDFLVTEFVLN